MPSSPPVDFQSLVKQRGSSGSDYPYAIKAADLMQNFVFATLEVADDLVEENAGLGGHTQRRLKISPGQRIGDVQFWNGEEWVPLSPPQSGKIHVLACRGSAPFWLETEEC